MGCERYANDIRLFGVFDSCHSRDHNHFNREHHRTPHQHVHLNREKNNPSYEEVDTYEDPKRSD